MKKLLVFAAIAVAAIAAAVFVAPLAGFAVLDSQCHVGGCSGQVCSSAPWVLNAMTTCEWRPEYVCNRDCRVRNFRCGFDEEFRKQCLECVEKCKTRYGVNEYNRFPDNYEDSRGYESCIMACGEK